MIEKAQRLKKDDSLTIQGRGDSNERGEKGSNATSDEIMVSCYYYLDHQNCGSTCGFLRPFTTDPWKRICPAVNTWNTGL